MVADAYDAVMAVDGVTEASILLDDHFASQTINEGVAARAGFVASFHGEAQDELAELRANFLHKAVLAGQDRVARPLLAERVDAGAGVRRRARRRAASPDLDRLRHRRGCSGCPPATTPRC